MNQTELIARVRRNAFIRDNHPDYTDQIILDELNDALRSIYEGLVTVPRQGHWLKQYTFSSTVNQQSARITARAVVGGLEKVEIGETNDRLFLLEQVVENHAQWYETFGGRTGMPQYYCIRGDQIDFLPSFDRVMTVRVSYYIRPSFIAAAQSTPATSGLITVVNAATRAITVPVPAFGKLPNSPNLGISAVNTITDIVHPNGTFELSAVSLPLPSSVVGSIYTYPVGADLTDVQVGDFLRCEGETDWPPLPEEFHRTVADTAAVKIMLQLNMTSKASALASSVGGDIERLSHLMNVPRTRSQPKRVGLSMITFGSNRWRPRGQ